MYQMPGRVPLTYDVNFGAGFHARPDPHTEESSECPIGEDHVAKVLRAVARAGVRVSRNSHKS